MSRPPNRTSAFLHEAKRTEDSDLGFLLIQAAKYASGGQKKPEGQRNKFYQYQHAAGAVVAAQGLGEGHTEGGSSDDKVDILKKLAKAFLRNPEKHGDPAKLLQSALNRKRKKNKRRNNFYKSSLFSGAAEGSPEQCVNDSCEDSYIAQHVYGYKPNGKWGTLESQCSSEEEKNEEGYNGDIEGNLGTEVDDEQESSLQDRETDSESSSSSDGEDWFHESDADEYEDYSTDTSSDW